VGRDIGRRRSAWRQMRDPQTALREQLAELAAFVGLVLPDAAREQYRAPLRNEALDEIRFEREGGALALVAADAEAYAREHTLRSCRAKRADPPRVGGGDP